MDVTVGTNMSKLRKQFNLTQREICSVVGVNTSTYKHYELGDVPISVLKDLAKFYKVSTNYFFENMPELSDNESLELSNFALKVADNTPKYVKVTFKEMCKYFDKQEEKTQARIRLRIKKLRLENNKSQKVIAKYLKIDLSTYNKYEKGSRKLSNEVVKKLAEYYSVSVSDIAD